MANLDYNQFQAYIDGLYADGEMSEQDYNDIILYILANGETEKKPRDLIQVRRGFEENLPTLAQGELGFTLDSENLYIGGMSGNINVGNPKSLNSIFINVKHPPNGLKKAEGNDEADDTLAIQECINYVESLGGGIVFLPVGTYKLTNHLLIKSSNVIIQGAGNGSTLKVYAPTNAIRCNTPDIENIILKDFSVNGNGNGLINTGIILINYAKNFLIENLHIYNTGNDVNGIATSQVGTMGVIRNCHVHNTGKGGIYSSTETAFLIIENNIVHDVSNSGFDIPGIQVIGGHNTRIVNNVVYNCPKAGIYAYTGDNFPNRDDVSWGTIIMGNVCYGNKRGIFLDNSLNHFTADDLVALNVRNIISNNQCYGNTETGIKVDNTNNLIIANNLCYENTSGSAGSGIFISRSKHLIIEGNILMDNTYSGIIFNGIGFSTITGNRSYNYLTSQGRGILFQTSESTDLIITNNYLKGDITNISGASLLLNSITANNSPEFPLP